MEKAKLMVRSGGNVDLVITDIFFNDEVNIFGLVRSMEKIPKLWNTPLAIYTNEATLENVHRIRKEIAHLPFRFILKGSDETTIAIILKEMISYKISNQKYLDLELKVRTNIKLKNISMLPKTLGLIDEYGQKYPKICSSLRMELLRGKLYNKFSKILRLQLDPIVEELQGISSDDDAYDPLVHKLQGLTDEVDGLREKARKRFAAAHEIDRGNWKVLYALYQFYMDEKDYPEAKDYLVSLIKTFPKNWDYFFKMGKINEIENDFLGAAKNYFEAARNALEEGASNMDLQALVEIAERSLETGQEMLNKMGESEIRNVADWCNSSRAETMRVLRKNNAQVRSILLYASKMSPQNADYLNKIGITFRRAGDYFAAAREYHKALKIEPENPRIHLNLIVALSLANDWEKALEELKIVKSLNADPEDELVILELGQILCQKNSEGLRNLISSF